MDLAISPDKMISIRPKEGEIKAILFNGPSGIGKDEGYHALAALPGLNPIWRPFATLLKHMTCRFFDTPYAWYSYEKRKDVTSKEFNGLTPRQAYIWMSEEVVKPKFGKYYWAEKAVEYYFDQIYKNGSNLKSAHTSPFIVTDLGFQHELEPIFKKFKSQNVLIIRVHRNGCDFKNDSREYIRKNKTLRIVDINNNKTLAVYKQAVIDVARTFLES